MLPRKADDRAVPLAELEKAIRDGHGDETRSALESWGNREVPRQQLALFAQLCWRSGIADMGIRVLNPIVRADRRNPQVPAPEEKAEYAACLIKIGAPEEGLELLKELDPQLTPVTWLYQAFGLVTHWNYRASIAPLEKYLGHPQISSYQRLVGKANLAAALVYERKRLQADFVLRDLLHATSATGSQLLLGTAMGLTAANFVLGRRWSDADAFLKRASGLIRDGASLDSLFIEKWQTIQRFLRSPRDESAQVGLHALRARAVTRQHWETVRDCDRYEAIALKSHHLLQHLYFGTPYDDFRERLVRDFGTTAKLPREYDWNPSDDGGSSRAYRFLQGETPPRGKPLKVGQLVHRTLSCLCSDFYRPMRLATLHFRVFPNEHYNPESSPHRIHEALRRSRDWLEETGIPLVIQEKNGLYSLTVTAPCRVVIPKRELIQHRIGVVIQRLSERGASGSFSVREATQALGGSMRTTLRLLEEGQKLGVISREGVGRSTRYRILVEK